MTTQRTFKPWTPVALALCAAAGYGLSLCADWLWLVRAALGVVLLVWLPGLPLAYLALPRTRVRLFDLGAMSFGLGLVAMIAATTIAKAFAPALTTGLYIGIMLGLSAFGLALVRKRIAQTRVIKPAGRAAVKSAAGCLIVLAVPLLTTRPMLVDEDHYWPISLYSRLERLNFASALQRVTMHFEDADGEHSAEGWTLTERGGELVIHNPASTAASGALRLLVEVYGESMFELWQGGARLESLYAHPRFKLREHPRNYPPPNFLVETNITVTPGQTRVQLKLAPWPRADHAVRAVVTDVTTPSRVGFWRRFRRRYLVGNTGDTREQLCLARSLLDKPFLYSYSYDGTLFDSGGYTISNLPLPYYAYSFMLLLGGDSMRSLHVLYLGELAALFLLLCALARGHGRFARGQAQVAALLPVLAYATLMRFMIESLYIHTLLTLFLLLAVYAILRGNRWLFALFVLFLMLTKGGVVAVVLLLVAATMVRPKRDLRLRPLWLSTLACALVAAALLGLAGFATGSIARWFELARGTDYGGRFGQLRQAIAMAAEAGDFRLFTPLVHAAWDLTLRAALACCLLPVWLLWRGDRVGWWLALAGLGFHVIVCMSDLVWPRVGSYVHPLNYFTPAAVLWAVAGARAVLYRGLRVRLCAAGIGCVCVIACHFYVAAYARHFVRQGAAQCEDFTLAVNDYLLRRGAAQWKSGKDLDVAVALVREALNQRSFQSGPTPKIAAQRRRACGLLSQLGCR